MTLYSRLTDVEESSNTLKELNVNLSMDVAQLQKEVFKSYENNPVLIDAMKDKQSVSESLEELAQVNKGIKKILPWRKNKIHNERLGQIGELIREPYHLQTNGIFMPDNLITTGAYVTGMSFGMFYLFGNCILPINPTNLPEIQRMFQVKAPLAFSALMGPLFGFMTNFGRFNNLLCVSQRQAKYLDEKVEEFYK